MSVRRVSKIRSRIIPDHSANCRLTQRDRHVIALVALHGVASGSQLQRFGHFRSTSRRNRCLRRMFDAKYLRRTFVACGPYAAEAIYVLGPHGASVAAEQTGLDLTELRRQACRHPARMYLEHHLAVLDVRLSIMKPPPGVLVHDFATEPECRHEYELVRGPKRMRALIKPDGFVMVERLGAIRSAFLEVDRGHVSLPQMKGVFERYNAYLRDGVFRSTYNLASPFEVLVITTAGNRRIGHLSALAKGLQVRVRFALLDDLADLGFYGQVWRAAPSGPVHGFFDTPIKEVIR